MNKALINFLHIKRTSVEIVRQIAGALVMQRQRDDSVRGCVCCSSTWERCCEGREISMRDGSENILIKKARRKARFPVELEIKGSFAYAGITRRVQGAELRSQLCPRSVTQLPGSFLPFPSLPPPSPASPGLI